MPIQTPPPTPTPLSNNSIRCCWKVLQERQIITASVCSTTTPSHVWREKGGEKAKVNEPMLWSMKYLTTSPSRKETALLESSLSCGSDPTCSDSCWWGSHQPREEATYLLHLVICLTTPLFWGWASQGFGQFPAGWVSNNSRTELPVSCLRFLFRMKERRKKITRGEGGCGSPVV